MLAKDRVIYGRQGKVRQKDSMIEDTARAVLNANTSLNIPLLNLRDWSSLRKTVFLLTITTGKSL